MRMRDLLLIEDGALFRKMLRDFLIVNGYNTLAVSSREEANKYVLTQEFRAIIMDYIGTGQLSASGFMRRIRGQGPNCATPVIVITALPYLPEKLDVEVVLSKPFDFHHVTRRLRNLPMPGSCARQNRHAFDALSR